MMTTDFPATIEVAIQRLPHAPEDVPTYQTEGAVGMDLQAAIDTPLTLNPLERALVPTGWVIALPEGYEAQVRARSGLSIKHGISLINAVGTIDWDYRHEVKVGLVNLSNDPYTIQPGDRIAQLVVAPVTRARWREVPEVSLAVASSRAGGFGSTGR
jgi:dUTP pyrophosphatase